MNKRTGIVVLILLIIVGIIAGRGRDHFSGTVGTEIFWTIVGILGGAIVSKIVISLKKKKMKELYNYIGWILIGVNTAFFFLYHYYAPTFLLGLVGIVFLYVAYKPNR